LQDLQRILQSVKHFSQGLSSFSDSLWFTESSGKSLVLIDLVVELELEGILRFSNQEVSNGLWNRVLDTSQNDSEIAIDSLSEFPNEDVATLSLLRWLLVTLATWTSLSVMALILALWVVWLSWLIWGNDIGSSILVS
jgi:hypothetical protein